jgi:hypothetical protein
MYKIKDGMFVLKECKTVCSSYNGRNRDERKAT